VKRVRAIIKKTFKKCVPLLALYRSIKEGMGAWIRLYLRRKINRLHKTLSPGTGTPQFIVTLTSYGERIVKTAPYSIYTLFRQSLMPDRIILWLAEGTAVPAVLEGLKNNGLEILFYRDIKSYKKLIPALRLFPNDVLITADDDVYYPRRWFKELKEAYLHDPAAIYCHRAHEITVDGDKKIQPYGEWNLCINRSRNGRRIFPTGEGGILYPPHSLHPRCMDEAVFQKIAPRGDDIWFWAMAKLQGTKHAVLENSSVGRLAAVDPKEALRGLWVENVHDGGNDRQLNAVIEAFPEILELVK
jgi:hypothetical protein